MDDEGEELVRKLEELAQKRDAQPPPELTDEVVINLAGMTPLQYAQQLAREAKKYRTPVRLLEKAVEAARVEIEVEKLLEPHWGVTPAEDPVDAAKLLAEIEARILHHLAMPRHLAFVVALWIGQSWIHEHATYSPILFITSPERDSGKSTLCGVIGFLVRRSLLSVGISASALYRSVEKWHPSFVIDEADKAFVTNPDLLQVVNSGWTRGQGVVRCDPDTHEPRSFSTFCPKVVALKGKEAPDTILSRAIFISMKRRTRAEPIAHFAHIDDAGFQRLRSQLARWAADNGATLGLADPAMPDGFMNRTAGNWRLMFAIADSLGGDAGIQARDAAQRIFGVTDMASAAVALLIEIREIFARSTVDYLTSKALVADLTADPEKQWAEWSRSGKPITEKGVAGLLHEFRIVSKAVGPDAAAKGYRKRDFADAWERYLASERATDGESEPDPPILPSTRQTHWNDDGNGEKFAVNRGADRRPKNGRFSNEIKEFEGLTEKHRILALSLSVAVDSSEPFDDGLDIPDFLNRTLKSVSPDRRPALGPEGDSLDDLK
jgi:hypothetical protein